MTDEYRVDDPVVPDISTQEDLPERIRIAKATQHAVGSHGFVRLIDAFGSDQDVAEAARTSYGEGTRQLQKDSHLLRYLMRHRHCYDDQTEVLTSEGFLPWSEVVKRKPQEVQLGIWDDAAGTLCYEPPAYFTTDQYKGDMYSVEHGGVSLLVTPEHSMWVSVGKAATDPKSFRLLPASELGDRSCVRYSKLAPYVGGPRFVSDDVSADSSEALLRFVGFFIGDGSVAATSANCCEFNLKKQRKRAYLRELCMLLGWELREGTKHKLYVHTDGLSNFCRRFYTDSGDKQIPIFLCRLGQQDAQAVLDGLRNSDGTSKRSTWEYATSLRHVAEAVQLLGLHAGEACHICEKSCGMFSVMFLSRMAQPVVNQGRVNTSRKPYDGLVYCAKTRTGVLVVRRNGKIVLSGNSTPFEMCEIKLLVQVPMDIWRQWVRHRTACLSADTQLVFNRPCDGRAYRLSVGEVYDKFQHVHRRERVQDMQLRCVNEDTGEVLTTNIVDVWQSGEKNVFKLTLESGRVVRASEDHLFFTPTGWKKLKQLSVGDEVVTISSRVGVPAARFNEIDPETEEWIEIVGWEGFYEVSNQGRVRRIIGGKGSRSHGRCKQLTVSNERAVTSLNRPGKQVVVLVHREMLRAFDGEPATEQEACHKNGNSLDNRLDNLYWGTRKENAEDMVEHGRATYMCSQPQKIAEISPDGFEMTYDLEVAGPWHNFSADDVVVHNSINEYSTRYSEAIDAMSETSVDDWRRQSTTNRQGSALPLDQQWPENFETPSGIHRDDMSSPGHYLTRRERDLHVMAREVYEERLQFGVAREQARKDLPLSNYTRAYWKCDLHNLLHFLSLRMDSHAQKEIRDYANVIGQIAQALWPATWAAFVAYRLEAVSLSAIDIAVVSAMQVVRSAQPNIGELELLASTLPKTWTVSRHRERDELLGKLSRLGLLSVTKEIADIYFQGT